MRHLTKLLSALTVISLLAASCSSTDSDPNTADALSDDTTTEESEDVSGKIVAREVDPPVSTTTTVPTPPLPEPDLRLDARVGTPRSLDYLAARTEILPRPGTPSAVRILDGKSCTPDNGTITFTKPGTCLVSVSTAGRSSVISFNVEDALERSDVDRDGGNVLDIKPVYIRFSDSPDMERDTNGQIASLAQGLADFIAVQHPGNTLRLDTFNGGIDVQHIELPITTAEALEQWDNNLGPIGPMLIEHGIDVGMDTFYTPSSLLQGIDELTRIVVGVIEAPRGVYVSPNVTTNGGCGTSSGNAFYAYFVRDLDGTECEGLPLEFSGSDQPWAGYEIFRLIRDPLRGHPGCGNQLAWRYENTTLDERPAHLAPLNDPVAVPYRGSEFPKILDPLQRFYFKVDTQGETPDHCQDIIYSPYLQSWHHGDQPADDITSDGRSVVDRPDDLDGDQVRVLYVLPADAPDQRWDIDGRLHTAAQTANEWLSAHGQATVRFDSYRGKLDVGFVRLEQTEAELWIEGDNSCVVDSEPCPHPRMLIDLLNETGVTTDGKLHALIWGGQLMAASTINGSCAGAMPDKNAVFLSPELLRPIDTAPICGVDVETTVPNSRLSLGLLMLHEIFHVLGAVDHGAPDTDGHQHIDGDPTDLMGRGTGIVTLDRERRNYWRHGRTDIADVATSTYINSGGPSSLRRQATTSENSTATTSFDGESMVLMGHSFFWPVAELFSYLASTGNAPGHTQNLYVAGSDQGAPEAFWNNDEQRTRIQDTLASGDIDTVGMTYHPAYPTSVGYRAWIDEALKHNPDTRFFIAIPWPLNPTALSPNDYQDLWQSGMDELNSGLLAELQTAYPDTTIIVIEYGQIAADLYLTYDNGSIYGLDSAIGSNGVFTDAMGHPGPVLTEQAAELWLEALYN